MSLVFGVWYSVWVEYCASFNHTCEWFVFLSVCSDSDIECCYDAVPYPFLTVNELPGRIAIYVVVTFVAFLSFRGINKLHARITGRVQQAKGKGKGKEKAN